MAEAVGDVGVLAVATGFIESDPLFVGMTITGGFTGTAGNPTGTRTDEWLRDDEPIEEAEATTYTLVTEDAGVDNIKYSVSFTNLSGMDGATSGARTVIAAPVAAGSPPAWEVEVDTGNQTYDAKAQFTAVGDPSKVTITYALIGEGGGPFLEGVFEGGVWVEAVEGGYLSIDPETGIVTVNTAVSGPLDGVEVVVRGTTAQAPTT